jgi:hypothetical protein
MQVPTYVDDPLIPIRVNDLAQGKFTGKTQLETGCTDWYLDYISAHERTDPLNPSYFSHSGRRQSPPPARLDKDQSLSRTRTPHAVPTLSLIFIDRRSPYSLRLFAQIFPHDG